ncbi:MAG: ubiquinol-cytochrome C chaperone family protein [Phaeospirillum sp.]|nr:ubiquinol-cytochrome C chaperone family protein [Phaeospirillum sp.]
MPFRRMQERRRREQGAHALYTAIIEQSRLPIFYMKAAVPDTLDGRFDLIVLHAFMVMRRLGLVSEARVGEARALSQALFDLMFDDMDQNLRELGVGDMSVGKKVKQMAQAFYGRVAAYEDGLNADDAALREALLRNLYGTLGAAVAPSVLAAMAAYLRRQVTELVGQDEAAVLGGLAVFSGLEEFNDA